MCSYSAEVVTNHSPGCSTACGNCTWSSEVSSSAVGTNCVFSWTVTRAGCGDDSRSGETTVACGTTRTISFFCDGGENCVGFKLKLSGQTCPPAGGGPM